MTSSTKIKSYDLDYIWHPFTQMKEYLKEDPLVIEDSDGVYLIDSDGNRYIDGVSSLWVNIHGHKVSKINKAIKNQVDKIAHSTLLGVTNPSASLLAKKLIDISPAGLKKVFYSGDGASAVEVALKMAFQYWLIKGKKRKNNFVCLKDGYHGDTLGAVSVGGIDVFHSTFKPLLFKSYKIPSYDSSDNTIARLESILIKKADTIAALIMEPYVQAAGGIKVATKGYLKKIQKLISTNYYNTEISKDINGVETMGAIKNIYAMLVGASLGLSGKSQKFKIRDKYYHNTSSALLSKSLAEMKLFSKKMKGLPQTAYGLAGIGDLYVSVAGGRNSQLGKYLGNGHKLSLIHISEPTRPY